MLFQNYVCMAAFFIVKTNGHLKQLFYLFVLRVESRPVGLIGKLPAPELPPGPFL